MKKKTRRQQVKKATKSIRVRILRTPYMVIVTFDSPRDPKLEKTIEKAARSKIDGCGYFLMGGVRDLQFNVLRRASAVAMAKRIKALSIAGLKVTVEGQVWP